MLVNGSLRHVRVITMSFVRVSVSILHIAYFMNSYELLYDKLFSNLLDNCCQLYLLNDVKLLECS